MLILEWVLLVVVLIGLPPVQKRLSAAVAVIERIAGAVLMGFGVWILATWFFAGP